MTRLWFLVAFLIAAVASTQNTQPIKNPASSGNIPQSFRRSIAIPSGPVGTGSVQTERPTAKLPDPNVAPFVLERRTPRGPPLETYGRGPGGIKTLPDAPADTQSLNGGSANNLGIGKPKIDGKSRPVKGVLAETGKASPVKPENKITQTLRNANRPGGPYSNPRRVSRLRPRVKYIWLDLVGDVRKYNFDKSTTFSDLRRKLMDEGRLLSMDTEIGVFIFNGYKKSEQVKLVTAGVMQGDRITFKFNTNYRVPRPAPDLSEVPKPKLNSPMAQDSKATVSDPQSTDDVGKPPLTLVWVKTQFRLDWGAFLLLVPKYGKKTFGNLTEQAMIAYGFRKEEVKGSYFAFNGKKHNNDDDLIESGVEEGSLLWFATPALLGRYRRPGLARQQRLQQ